jgi:hypothetical protein
MAGRCADLGISGKMGSGVYTNRIDKMLDVSQAIRVSKIVSIGGGGDIGLATTRTGGITAFEFMFIDDDRRLF